MESIGDELAVGAGSRTVHLAAAQVMKDVRRQMKNVCNVAANAAMGDSVCSRKAFAR